MSKYLLNKFLFTVDRDPDLVERYREDPAGTVAWWEADPGQPHPQLHRRRGEHLAGVHRRGARRRWSRTTTSPLFEMGAHPFLTLTLFIAMFERDHPSRWRTRWPTAPRWRTCRCPTPTSPPEPCAPRPITAHGRPAEVARPRRPGARAGRAARRGHRRADRAARPALRIGHVVLRAHRRCPTCRACRASGWCAPGRRSWSAGRVWFPTTAGMAPGDGSLAELRGGHGRRGRRGRGRPPRHHRGARSGCRPSPPGRCSRAGPRCARARRCSCWAPAGPSARSPCRPPGCSAPAGSSRRPARPPRCERARARGADAVVDLRADDDAAVARRALRDACGGVGRRRRRPARRHPGHGRGAGARRRAGGWSTSAAPPAPALSVDSAALRSRSAAVLGYTNTSLTDARRRAVFATVLGHAAAGRLEVTHDVVPLDGAPAAWEAVGARHGIPARRRHPLTARPPVAPATSTGARRPQARPRRARGWISAARAGRRRSRAEAAVPVQVPAHVARDDRDEVRGHDPADDRPSVSGSYCQRRRQGDSTTPSR